jgi:hypothetical protein
MPEFRYANQTARARAALTCIRFGRRSFSRRGHRLVREEAQSGRSTERRNAADWDWLEKLGMSEYAQRFAESGIDFEILFAIMAPLTTFLDWARWAPRPARPRTLSKNTDCMSNRPNSSGAPPERRTA